MLYIYPEYYQKVQSRLTLGKRYVSINVEWKCIYFSTLFILLKHLAVIRVRFLYFRDRKVEIQRDFKNNSIEYHASISAIR